MPSSWDDWLAAVSGSADPEQRERVSKDLSDPTSKLSRELSAVGTSSEMLFGPLPVVLPVTTSGFIIKNVVFWLVWIATVAFLFSYGPVTFNEILWHAGLGAGMLAFAGIRTRAGFRELQFAGINTRGTLKEAVEAALFGVLVTIALVILVGWLRMTYQEAIHGFWPIPMFFSFKGLSRGHGFRMQSAASQMNLWQRANRGSLHFCLAAPWAIGIGWCIGWLVGRLLSLIAPPLAEIAWPYILIGVAIGIAGVAAVEASLEKPSMKGNWQSAIEGAVVYGATIGFGFVFIVAFAWILGFAMWPWAVGATLLFTHLGFSIGADQGFAATRDEQGKRVLAFIGALIPSAAVAALAAAVPWFLLSEWLGNMNRAVGALVGFATLIVMMNRLLKFLEHRLNQPITGEVAADESETTIAVTVRKKQFLIGLPVGLSLLGRHLELALAGLRGAQPQAVHW